MEYLPEKKRTQKMQIMKKEQKIRDFREYLADSEVVLALVKCKHFQLYNLFVDLLAVRSANPMPDDPVESLKDYFGQYRDPQWDLMDTWREENAQMVQEIPQVQNKIAEIEV